MAPLDPFSRLDAMLRAIGVGLGIALALDPDGSALVEVKAGLQCTLSLSPENDEVRLAAPVAGLAGYERAPLLSAALRLTPSAAPARVGLLPGHDALIAVLRLPLEGLEQEALAAALAGFLEQGLVWRDSLAAAARPLPAADLDRVMMLRG